MKIAGLSVLLLLVAGTCVAQSTSSSPVVVSAGVPFYPRVAQAAHIDGTVQLRISTDGTGVSSIDIESGPAMLARAAEEDVKTWQFEKHAPATIEATFRYVLLPSKCDSKCDCDDTQHDTVQLRLPTYVEVDAKTAMICDPAVSKH
jgi:TonB family protein